MSQHIQPRVEEEANPQQQKQQGNPGREEDVGVDQNVEIVVALAYLRHLSDVFKEGDQLHCSLGQTIDTIIGTICDAQGALYDITYFRDSRREFYANGMSYKDVKNLKITKDMLFSLFRDPSNGMTPRVSKPNISIDWCI